MAILRHAARFRIAHVAFWAAACAANMLLVAVFDVVDCGLCFPAMAAMRQASHRQVFLE